MCVITPPNSDDEHHQHQQQQQQNKKTIEEPEKTLGSVLMSATVGTSKMEVINGDDKNLYATVQTVSSTQGTPSNGEL